MSFFSAKCLGEHCSHISPCLSYICRPAQVFLRSLSMPYRQLSVEVLVRLSLMLLSVLHPAEAPIAQFLDQLQTRHCLLVGKMILKAGIILFTSRFVYLLLQPQLFNKMREVVSALSIGLRDLTVFDSILSLQCSSFRRQDGSIVGGRSGIITEGCVDHWNQLLVCIRVDQ